MLKCLFRGVIVVAALFIRNYSRSPIEPSEILLLQSNTVHCYVDLFTIITKPHEYAYISKGDFWLSLHLMQTLTNKDKNNSTNDSTNCINHHLRLHIFTDTRWIIDYGNDLGYYMYNISSSNRGYRAADEIFMGMYRPNHHSINTVEYEYLCFFRWHLFRIVVDNWEDSHAPINRIITMDSDAIITTDAFTLYNNLYLSLDYNSENDFDLIVITPGAFHLWSVHGLRTYSDFIYSWYNASVDTVLANTKKVAGYLYGRLHFSDMQVRISLLHIFI